MTSDLIRIEYAKHCTLGVLRLDGEAFCCTLEDAWHDNSPFISCIPEGVYKCRRFESPKFGTTFEITGVDGRTYILFHPGNTEHNTMGCVLLGQYWGKLLGDRAVLNSGNTFREFLNRTRLLKEFYLRVMSV